MPHASFPKGYASFPKGYASRFLNAAPLASYGNFWVYKKVKLTVKWAQQKSYLSERELRYNRGIKVLCNKISFFELALVLGVLDHALSSGIIIFCVIATVREIQKA